MAKDPRLSDNELGSELLRFRSAFRSVLLATVTHDGVPEASYAPYVADDDGHFYLYVSGLSRHTRNLQESGRASLLFIEDEQSARNIFARKRLSYACVAEFISRDDAAWSQILDRFTERFGKFVDTLRALPDFQLFRLTPKSGSYVRGFAQAYSFEGLGMGKIHQLNPAEYRLQTVAAVATAEEILEFWFSERVRPLWYRTTADFDTELRERFLPTWQAAAAGRLGDWENTAQGALALTIVLDQFPLNMFRGTPKSFSTEAASRRVAGSAIERGFDRDLEDAQKAFLYMPFMHSEDIEDQDRSVALFASAGLEDNLKWARHHRKIIRRFGRFPHRNAILGRNSTPEELEYLGSKESFRG